MTGTRHYSGELFFAQCDTRGHVRVRGRRGEFAAGGAARRTFYCFTKKSTAANEITMMPPATYTSVASVRPLSGISARLAWRK